MRKRTLKSLVNQAAKDLIVINKLRKRRNTDWLEPEFYTPINNEDGN